MYCAWHVGCQAASRTVAIQQALMGSGLLSPYYCVIPDRSCSKPTPISAENMTTVLQTAVARGENTLQSENQQLQISCQSAHCTKLMRHKVLCFAGWLSGCELQSVCKLQ
jgi:hypothetical protein